MATGSTAGWRSALAEIERAIGDCLAALDRYESAFANILGPIGPTARGPEPGDNTAAWEERLTAAGDAADAVERLLAEQEVVWGRWQAALADWRRLAGAGPETGGTAAGTSASNGEGGE
jgi:hypothetical protein